MARTIRFHLDEHVHPAIADGLRRRGIDVTTTADVGLLGESDEQQANFASSQNRLLFTQDAGFLRRHNSGWQHAGVAYCRQHSRSIGEIIRSLVLIWELLEPDEMKNRVEFL